MVITEAVVQVTSERFDWVDFAMAWMRVLRNLKEKQERGDLDSVSYLYLKRDIENMLHEITQKLLFAADF